MTREEAIKEIKSWDFLNKKETEAIETLIPELRESESNDEKIRKELIEFIKWSVDRHFMREDFHQAKRPSEWIAYLEKQKAKERLDRMAPIYNDKESFESALEKAWKYYNESASRKVDSFEDDYIECVFSKGFREGFLYREKQKEQKPKQEWSKEDDEMRINILQEIANIKDVFPKINIQPEFDWLKSLPERFNLQPKQEWTEEDEQMRGTCIDLLEHFPRPCGEVIGPWKDCIAWLKSLRPPQYCENCKLKRSVENWKPSEEQMEHLKRCISHGKPHLPMPNQHVLESLYNDLKKLM